MIHFIILRDAKVTTSSNPDNPEYYIRIRKGKLVPGSKISRKS